MSIIWMRTEIPSGGGANAPSGWFYVRMWQITDDATGTLKTITVRTVARSGVNGAEFTATVDGNVAEGQPFLRRNCEGLLEWKDEKSKTQKGFSLIELLVAVAILVIVAGTVIAGMINTMRSEGTVMNRTQVHASVRNATELMEQEIGQAGRLPAAQAGLKITFATALAANPLGTTATPTITSTAGIVPRGTDHSRSEFN